MAQRQRSLPTSDQSGEHAPTDQPQPAANTETEAPERPQLAPNVVLTGEMQQSGFRQQQWLVQRNGRFIQLTGVLYHLLEQVDGERSLDEIARRLSDVTDRQVNADQVSRFISKKLIPLGLIARADGSVVDRGEGPRSALQIGLRTRVVTPAIIDPITSVLHHLYWPPIVAVVLVLSALAQGWVFFVHGIAQSVHQTLFQPALMLLMMGIIIVSAAFHEVGHASALRHGGGQVRGMGVGLYLVYPAFYTDVTDNYRLSRWNRIRTDLGGFYFNLIFALVVMGVYALTKQDFLLLAVLFVDMDIIRQVLPFVRLDGYWALADLTGLPDFFSQILPFLRTVLPLPWWKDGRTMPNLKGWVKSVFSLYILVTVPLLLFLLFLTVQSVPRVFATDLSSFKQHGHTLAADQSSGNILGVVVNVLELGLLLLPTVGLVLMLYQLGRGLVRLIWNWSKPTAGRRAVGVLGSLVAILFVAYLWAPRLPFLGSNAHGPFFSPVMIRPVSAHERGTLIDGARSLPLFGGPTSAAFPAPHHGREGGVVHAMRRFPVIGGVVNAVIPPPGHRGLLDGIRSVPVVGGIVDRFVPRTPWTTVAPRPSVSGSSAGATNHTGSLRGSSAAGRNPAGHAGPRSASTSTSGTGSGSTSHPVSGGSPGGSSPGTAGSGSARVGQSGSASGSVSAGVSGTPGVAVTAGVGVAVSPGVGVTAGVGVNTTAGVGVNVTVGVGVTPGVVQTPVAAVTAVSGAVKTPVAAVTAASGVVKTPVAAVTAASGLVKTPVAAVTRVSGSLQNPSAAVTSVSNTAKSAPVPTVVP